ncbi:MAG: efflux RND transporter permease subunit, partial [Chloroflexi bacterium]|nr:efflux RND transporter permease subunit [Chloroflexota bacterium]
DTGFPQAPQGPQTGKRAIKVADVADVELTTADSQRISRANGKPGLILAIVKDPDANTADVTEAVTAAMNEMIDTGVIPPHVQVLEISNNGPQVRESLASLLREGTVGFLFAVATVFIFLLNVRPSLMRGIALSLRPTAIIAISIPLSLLTGILLLSLTTDISLNFMSLAGLAIAVGRVVDDSIVVLENIYRHIHLGESRFEAAINGTQEVGAAIISSTLTTVVIFIPLAFISGVVGQFFSPFAISVSLALLASTVVAITIVPVLAASLLRRGDFDDDAISDSGPADRQSMIQRIYSPMLRWAIRYKFLTVAIAIIVTVASLGLITVIPITFFPTTTPEYLTINVELPVGTSVERTYQEALAIEEALIPFVERGWITLYQTTVGGRSEEFDSGAAGGFHLAGAFARLSEDVPEDVEDIVRDAMPDRGDDVLITVSGIAGGPAQGDMDVRVTGPNFNEIAEVSRQLEERLGNIDGIVNVSSTASEGKDEVVISVDPTKAGEYSLTTTAVGLQVNQFISGRDISEIDISGKTVEILIRGDRADVDDIENLKNLRIESPVGPVKLGAIAHIGIKETPLSIFRFESERSARITGNLVGENTRAIGVLVDQEIAALQAEGIPPGITITSGGIFEQINEGFQDVFIAMAVGVVLVSLVMVASLGALRTPFIIVLSLPLAVVGALLALIITDRTLSLSAMMGFLLLVGIVVTNAIVLLTFVEQLRDRGYDVFDALIEGGRVRLRPILMTAFTTTFALLPLAASDTDTGIIGAELATVVIGGLVSSTFLTLIVVPAVYWIFNVSIPSGYARLTNLFRRTPSSESAAAD